MNELLEKPYSILEDLFEVEDVDFKEAEKLRKAFCYEMASIIVSFKGSSNILLNGLNVVFLPDINEGNFKRAFQVYKFLEGVVNSWN